MSEPTNRPTGNPSDENPVEGDPVAEETFSPVYVPPPLIMPAHLPQPDETDPDSPSLPEESSEPTEDEPVVFTKRGPAQPVKKAPEAGKGPRRYSPLASTFIVLGALLFFPAILWIPQVISDRNDRQAVETTLDSTNIVWENYTRDTRDNLTQAILDKDCQGLQKVFTSVVDTNKATLTPDTKKSADILIYVNEKLTEYGCYKDAPLPNSSVTPAPSTK